MTMRARLPIVLVILTLQGLIGLAASQTTQQATRQLSGELQAALQRAGANAGELRSALAKASPAQREGMEFLIANMPDRDLAALSAEFLLENVQYAYKVMQEVPWGGSIPHEIFLNDVLPYASVSERRDRWRKDFYSRLMPLIKDCKTPARAAAVLNAKLFASLKVRYSKDRPKADQSPYESIEAGKASCTALAITLIDACRAVGVPARFVGTPMWTDRSGNHSWVEVWDDGWHFTGAGEPTGEVLDSAWFVHRAAAARRDQPRHAIYAVSFKRTPLRFPLAWDASADYVSAVNVTDHYTNRKDATPAAEAKLSPRLRFSQDEQAFLATPEGRELAKLLKRYFDASPGERGSVTFPAEMDALLARRPLTVRKLAWQAYVRGWSRKQYEADFKADRVTWDKYTSPYGLRAVGKMPENGWPLFIVMHGGGGAPKAVNDQQWRIMQVYYRDHAEKGGYLYLAPRAPTDDWNGFYAEYNLHLTDRLIRQMLLFRDVDPNKVYLIGYSHGGYGAFFQGMIMADRFAAVHASAAAPTDYNDAPRNLRNTPLTFMIGSADKQHGRYDRCKWLDECVTKLRGDQKDAYPVKMEVIVHGHAGLPDRDKIRDVYGYVRNAVPKHVSWAVGGTSGYFNWLYAPKPRGGSIEAVCGGNTITVTAEKVAELHLLLDERLIDYSKTVTVVANGARCEHRVEPSLRTLCETLQARGDFEYMFSSRLTLTLDGGKETK
ncbi:MAG TPA: transglutaminase domain-containing protein [Phycisphaerae bacterium]|nr:transglutaminase domain-containing protein [Phycisphaerae bacterium]